MLMNSPNALQFHAVVFTVSKSGMEVVHVWANVIASPGIYQYMSAVPKTNVCEDRNTWRWSTELIRLLHHASEGK